MGFFGQNIGPLVINSTKGQPTLRRNLLSSLETSAESHNHPFQLDEGVDDATETALADSVSFSAILQRMYEAEMRRKRIMETSPSWNKDQVIYESGNTLNLPKDCTHTLCS